LHQDGALWAEWSRIQFLTRTRDFPLPLNVQTNPRTHPASYSIRNGVSFPGHKAAVA